MALTHDPETGEITTTFLLEQRARRRADEAELYAIERRTVEDAVRWRSLPPDVRAKLERKYLSGKKTRP
jgi:hypothetical protein